MAEETDTFDPAKFEDVPVWEDGGDVTIAPLAHLERALEAALAYASKEAAEMVRKGFNRTAAHITHDAIHSSLWLTKDAGEGLFVEIYTDHISRKVSLRSLIEEMIKSEWGTKEDVQAVLDSI